MLVSQGCIFLYYVFLEGLNKGGCKGLKVFNHSLSYGEVLFELMINRTNVHSD